MIIRPVDLFSVLETDHFRTVEFDLDIGLTDIPVGEFLDLSRRLIAFDIQTIDTEIDVRIQSIRIEPKSVRFFHVELRIRWNENPSDTCLPFVLDRRHVLEVRECLLHPDPFIVILRLERFRRIAVLFCLFDITIPIRI